MTAPRENHDELGDDEAVRRRDEALKRALDMPPKPHKPTKGKTKGGARRQSAKTKAKR